MRSRLQQRPGHPGLLTWALQRHQANAESHPQTAAVEVVAIAAVDGVLRVAAVRELHEREARRARWQLQVDLHDTSILGEQVLNLTSIGTPDQGLLM